MGRAPGRVHRRRHRGQARGRRAPSRAVGPPVHERPQRAGVLDAAADRPPPGRDGDGLVRLPRRPPVDAPEPAQHRPERRARQLHAGALRRARAGDGADAGRGARSDGRGDRRRRPPRALAWLGQPRDRVLCDRDRDHPRRGLRGPRDPRSAAGARPVVTAVRAAAAVALATALFASAATARPTAHRGPFVTAARTAFLRIRAGEITAAVYNEGSGRLFLYRPGVAEAEARVAKVDILATLLYERQRQGEGPPPRPPPA